MKNDNAYKVAIALMEQSMKDIKIDLTAINKKLDSFIERIDSRVLDIEKKQVGFDVRVNSLTSFFATIQIFATAVAVWLSNTFRK